jgi:transposase-like protein
MQRKHYSAEFKAKIALEAIKGLKTINEIASEVGVHPTQITQWKKQMLDALPEVFSNTRSQIEQPTHPQFLVAYPFPSNREAN